MPQFRLQRIIAVGPPDPAPTSFAGAFVCDQTSDFRPVGNLTSGVLLTHVAKDAAGAALPVATASFLLWTYDETQKWWVRAGVLVAGLQCFSLGNVTRTGPLWVQLTATTGAPATVEVYLAETHWPS